MTPDPPHPFDAEETVLGTDAGLYRVHRVVRRGDEFNPGHGAPSRFAFFGEPTVPVLYAAETAVAAVAETLLHDVPVAGGRLPLDSYRQHALSLLRTRRDLHLAAFLGTGLRRLRVTADELTSTDATQYPRTVGWAEAAHREGFDGVVYMSRQLNSTRAYCLFGDRLTADDLEVDPSEGYAFALPGHDRDWLVDLCAPLHVDVLLA